MIKEISWQQILKIWQNELWPYRTTTIEPVSAMIWLGGHNMANMSSKPVFFGYFVNKKLVGVNSGHRCVDIDDYKNTYYKNNYRSRGLWVNPCYRRQGIARELLNATVQTGFELGHDLVWSYPRKSSWPVYQSVGFKLDSDWHATENGENAYCSIEQSRP